MSAPEPGTLFPTQRFPGKIEMDSTCLEWCEAHNSINSGEDVWRRSLHKEHGYFSILRSKNNIWKHCLFCWQPSTNAYPGRAAQHPQGRDVLQEAILIQKKSWKSSIHNKPNRVALHLKL